MNAFRKAYDTYYIHLLNSKVNLYQTRQMTDQIFFQRVQVIFDSRSKP